MENKGNEIEYFENEISMYLKMYCEEHDIKSMKEESQNVWNGALRYIRKYVFNDRKLKASAIYKTDNIKAGVTNFNSYNFELLDDVAELYISLCFDYDKECSLMGFHNLTGISLQTLNEWRNERVSLSPSSTEIVKKINAFREESLSNRLVTGKRNPVGLLGVLNHHFGWNLPNAPTEESARKPLGLEDLKLLDLSNYNPSDT